MAEPRRVQLTTLTSDLPSSSSSSSSSSSVCEPQGKKSSETEPGGNPDSVRLVLSLFESDENRFPEFSFTQLKLNKVRRSKPEVPLSKVEEDEKRDDDEVAAIARKLEEKYGGAKAHKKKDRIQDLIDIGYGYDDEDSFIDNSEAYDEFVPAAITTKLGGFYVNSGVLQFRQASDSETNDLAKDESSKKRKLIGGQDKPKKKPCKDDDEEAQGDVENSTLSVDSPNDELMKKKKRKKKRGVGLLSVTSMLKKFQREKEKERRRLDEVTQRSAGVMAPSPRPLCPAYAAGGPGGPGLTDPLLSLIGSTNDQALIQAASGVDLDLDLVSLLDASEEALPPVPPTETQSNDASPASAKNNFLPKSPQEQIHVPSESGSTQRCPLLPDGLTPALEEWVQKLVAVVKREGESKLKFFTPEVNHILLEMELQCRGQSGQVRSRLYTHLSSFLPCSRDTLLKRVRKLLLAHDEEPPDMEESVQNLKDAVSRAMPEQIATYRETCLTYEQVKASKAMEEACEGKLNLSSEDGVKRGGPKKLFKWNDEIRGRLGDVLRPKMDRYERERNQGSQEVEEYLKTLLDNEVKPLWPKGWMLSRSLFRESRKLLGYSSLPVKKSRPDKKQPCVGGASIMADPALPRPQVTDAPPGASDSPGRVSLDSVAMETERVPPTESAAASPHAASSLLDLLADQALAREKPLTVSQEILAAAIAKYQRSEHHWNVGVAIKTPPPAPQSSPVNSSLSQSGPVVLSQTGDFTRNLDLGQMQNISDASRITIQ